MITIRHTVMPLALLSAAALTACGGGGGSNDGASSNPSATSQKLAITEANYQAVVNSSGSSALQATQPTGAASLVGVESRTTNWMGYVQTALNQIYLADRADRSLVGVEQSDCQSGSLNTTYTDTNNNGIKDAGDVYQADFASCVVQDGSKFNGKLTVTLQNVTGVNGKAVKLGFNAFSAEQSGFSGSVNGTMLFVATPKLYLVQSSDLRLNTIVGGKTQAESWSNFSFSAEPLDGSSYDSGSVATFSGTLVSSEFDNKSVDIATPQGLQFIGEAEVPNAGKMVVTGANGSTATLTVNNELSVTLSVDTNGDGKIDKSNDTTWNQFIGS